MKRAALLFAIALPAFADRFDVTFEGKPVAGAEVCATRAGDLASPVTRFLTGGAAVCSPAKGEVRLPPGSWNVFARRGAELISDSAVIGGDAREHQLALVRAARVDGGNATHVYVVSTGALIPVSGAVPATRVVPLIVAAGGRIRAIGTPITPEAGKAVRFDFQPDAAGKGSVIVPAPLKAEVTLAGAKQRADSALLFFRDVPAGAQQIAFGGAQRSVKVEAGQVTIADPLLPRAKLRIHWWTPAALASLAPAERDRKATLELLECSARCTVVGTATLPADAVKGVAELPGVASGSYRVRVTYPGLPQFTANIDTPPEDVNLEIRYIVFSGKVTRGGEPLHVRLFDTVTDPRSGEYTAVVASLPKPPITLQPVDGGRAITLVPDAAPVENARYDIEVPDNRVVIHVVDADSHAPIEKANVSLAALENGKDEAAHFAGPTGLTDADGRLVIESAVANKRLQVCAAHRDYENACVDRFQLGSDREKTIELALNRAVARQGRVVLPGTQEFASIAWYSLDGRLTEVAQVKPDGTFEFQRTHAAGEIVTYSSANQPFIAMRQPPLDADQPFEIRPAPGARLRSFQVTLSSDKAFFTIALGDMIVPANPFANHLARHGSQPSLQPGWVANVPDVVESAPIRVILLPFSFVQSHDVGGVDFAMHPEVNSLPQQLLGERTRIVF